MTDDAHCETSAPLPCWLDSGRIAAVAPLGGIECHDELASTSDRALELAARADLKLPFLVAARRQTAGRGRGGNRWWSADGALLFSLVIEPSAWQIEDRRVAPVSLIAALALADAVDHWLARPASRLKWPNDVLLDDRKVCGILAEAPARLAERRQRLVLGIGLNLNNSLADAPPELRGTAASVVDQVGAPRDTSQALCDVLMRLFLELERHGRETTGLAARWRPRCALTGQRLSLMAGQRTVEGDCCGIDDDGQLLLLRQGTLERHAAGVVVRRLDIALPGRCDGA